AGHRRPQDEGTCAGPLRAQRYLRGPRGGSGGGGHGCPGPRRRTAREVWWRLHGGASSQRRGLPAGDASLNNVVLVGFMGSGKSTVGPHLAERLERPFGALVVLIGAGG